MSVQKTEGAESAPETTPAPAQERPRGLRVSRTTESGALLIPAQERAGGAQEAPPTSAAPAAQNAAPAQAQSAQQTPRHPTQIRLTTTRGDLAALPRQLNSTTVILPWNPDAGAGEDNEVNIPPDGVRRLRTGIALKVAAGYEAIITVAGQTGHRIPVASIRGGTDELVITYRNTLLQTRTFVAGQELAQVCLHRLEPGEMVLINHHAQSDGERDDS